MMVKGQLVLLTLLNVVVCTAQKQYKLAPPMADYGSLIFEKETTIRFAFGMPGAEIRYTTDGSEPTPQSLLYNSPVGIAQQYTTVTARSFAKGFEPSVAVSYSFYKTGKKITSVTGTAPNKKYSGLAENELHDGRSGSSDFNDGKWMGYDADSVVLLLAMPEATQVSQLMVHSMQQQGAWIFLPGLIKAYAMRHGKIIRSVQKNIDAYSKGENEAVGLPIECNAIADAIRLVLYPVTPLPDWHDGKGKKGWIFLDEIIVY